ncbi:hypothetical protein EVG20_g14 [Dentipellis fragilis]|uniref:HMA domain-containing protein n=1 Tax=Dentipellis fragilis TaxID=205917 RepID=A0A4Y9ZFL7_9AGAM|nr:hypothetical protein EVG20_g14 [Dentipellis fragilis]
MTGAISAIHSWATIHDSDLPGPVHTTPDGSDGLITTVFISNLHCSSCVRTLEETLNSLTPVPTSVEVSVVSQCVTVHHAAGLTSEALTSAIEDAGFDVAIPPEAGPSTRPDIRQRTTSFLSTRRRRHVDQCTVCKRSLGYEDSPAGYEATQMEQHAHSIGVITEKPTVPALICSYEDGAQGPFILTLSIGGMTCASCSSTITQSLTELPGVSDVAVSLLGNSATVTLERKDLMAQVIEAVEDGGYEAEVVSLLSAKSTRSSEPVAEGPYLLTLSIGGMTCASCSSTITRLLSELQDVSEVSINLLANSGSVVIKSKELAAKVTETIEDAGYDATISSLEPVKRFTVKGSGAETGLRTVRIRVEGMFCEHCPDKVAVALQQFGPRVSVEKPTRRLHDPVFQVTYRPSSPTLTIRTIVAAMASTNSPPFNVSIERPPSLEDRARAMHIREQRHLLNRLIFAVIVAIPTFIIGIVYMSLVPKDDPTKAFFMAPMWTGNASRIQWALFFLATPVMFYSAGIFHRRSIKEIYALWRKGSRTPVWKRFVRFGSMNLLVSAGVSVAYFSSIVLLALAASQSPASDGMGDITTYFDSVVFLAMFLLMGRYMEAYSKGRTADAMTSLGKLRPTQAHLVVPVWAADSPPRYASISDDVEKGDSEAEVESYQAKPGYTVQPVPIDMLDIGDIVRVQTGSTPPADGTVVTGETAFNESSLTGESKPIKKLPGDPVFLGTINESRSVDVRIDAIGGETMLDHVMKAVRDGQTKRAPIERVADLLTGYFVPVVTLLAILTWIIWLSLGESGVLPQDYLDIDVGGWPIWSLEFAIAVFVVACPCGIGLAAPTALLVGSGMAAKFGILARGGGEAFQEAAQLDVIVFDKTGTLTQGEEPRVTDVEELFDAGPWKRESVLGMAAEIESSSTHPLARAIRTYCGEAGALQAIGSSVEERPGRGLKAYFQAQRCTVIIGNEQWMNEHQVVIPVEATNFLEAWKSDGKSVVLLAARDEADGVDLDSKPFRPLVLFAVADPVRPNAHAVISRLQSQGLTTWMITGDNLVTAKAVARIVGIPETNVIAGAEKVRWLQETGVKKVSRWQRIFGQPLNERCIVAMVGDGINDAPALASADVPIAIGSGSDVALSSAAFILISSDLQSLLTLIDLARTVFRRVKFNFLWALMYNLAALPIAAGVIYPAGHARLNPVWGSLAMALSSVSVVCSSLVLKLYRPPATR